MTESRQDLIEISDFDYQTFQEFLRFLYCDEVRLDAIFDTKLLAFADKYVESDLIGKCMCVLKYDICSSNVYKILQFAYQEDISHLVNWCQAFLKNKINASNIAGFIEFVNKQNKPESAKENLEWRDKAISAVISNYKEIFKTQNAAFYEDFLIKNIAVDTVLTLVNFVTGSLAEKSEYSYYDETKEIQEKIEEEKETLLPYTMNLRAALSRFVETNVDALKENGIMKEIPHAFLVDLVRTLPKAKAQDRKDLNDGEKQHTSQ